MCFQAAKEYYQEHGDLLVPAKYETETGVKLGNWISWLRCKYNNRSGSGSPLYGDEIADLERIGMVWQLHRQPTWEEWLEQARLYREEHGDLLVPYQYEQNGYGLGDWIQSLRYDYKHGTLSEQRIRDLDALGMVWSRDSRREWSVYYPLAKRYYQRHGNLLIANHYVTAGGYPLGRWLMLQRERRARTTTRYKNAPPMPQEEIDALDRIGMIWGDLDEYKWELMFQTVREYTRKNGSLPPQSCPEKSADGRRIGFWVANQRQALRLGTLDEEKISRLRELGIARDTEVSA